MTITEPRRLRGAEVVGADGAKIGKVDNIYTDHQTGRPDWAAVKTGLFGKKVCFVPLARAEQVETGLRVPFDKDTVKAAPHHDPEGELSTRQEEELFQHYGIPYSGDTATAASGGTGGTATAGGDRAMTRSEQELAAGKARQETGRVRLHKWVETEPVEMDVPVERETAHVEREPITEANRDAAMSGPELRENVHEETLHEEHAVSQKRTVPKERVRLEKDTAVGQEHISDEVGRERLDVEKD